MPLFKKKAKLGKLSITLRHEQRHASNSIILKHMAGTPGVAASGQSVLAGTHVKGWVDVSGELEHSNSKLVIVLEAMERKEQVAFKALTWMPLHYIHEVTSTPVVDFSDTHDDAVESCWTPNDKTHIVRFKKKSTHVLDSEQLEEDGMIPFEFAIPADAPSSLRVESTPNFDAEIHRVDEFVVSLL